MNRRIDDSQAPEVSYIPSADLYKNVKIQESKRPPDWNRDVVIQVVIRSVPCNADCRIVIDKQHLVCKGVFYCIVCGDMGGMDQWG